jgi:hypothetical protein
MNGYYRMTLTGKRGDKKNATTQVTICVSSKSYRQKKTGKRRCKKLLYAIHHVRRTPQRGDVGGVAVIRAYPIR